MATSSSSSSATSIETRNPMCLCSPSNHPVTSFRCTLHENESSRKESAPASTATGSSSSSSSLNSFKTRSRCLCSPANNPSFRCRRHKNRSNRRKLAHAPKAKVKEFTLREFLQRIIKPPRRDETRRKNFRPTPSRFFTMHASNRSVPVSERSLVVESGL